MARPTGHLVLVLGSATISRCSDARDRGRKTKREWTAKRGRHHGSKLSANAGNLNRCNVYGVCGGTALRVDTVSNTVANAGVVVLVSGAFTVDIRFVTTLTLDQGSNRCTILAHGVLKGLAAQHLASQSRRAAP